jgi:CelD/BcsL family acetyltransferase involved in cellulose biosynthesis
MKIHTDWSTPAFGFEPVASGVGPFAGRGFLETWWGARGSGELMLTESGSALLPLHRDGGVVRFLGEPDLTDYHTPLGSGAAGLVAELVSSLPGGTRVSFDSLPVEASEVMGRGLHDAGVTSTLVRHEVSAVLSLQGTYEDHLALLSSKERHEIRRKHRRFVAALGEPALVRDCSESAFRAFVSMHRAAPGSKGSFFDEPMEALFGSLLRVAGAVLDLLVASDGTPVAAAFGFEEADAYYLYNSSFDPSSGHVSPGVVLVDRLIEAAIAAGRTRFDFLKGAEAYKFRMGAAERPLFRLEAER